MDQKARQVLLKCRLRSRCVCVKRLKIIGLLAPFKSWSITDRAYSWRVGGRTLDDEARKEYEEQLKTKGCGLEEVTKRHIISACTPPFVSHFAMFKNSVHAEMPYTLHDSSKPLRCGSSQRSSDSPEWFAFCSARAMFVPRSSHAAFT